MDMENNLFTLPDGRKVCPLGQGTYLMGRRRDEEIEALRRGIDLGLSVIDTAEMYGTESLVGEAVRGMRDKAYIVSKVLPGNASYEGTKRACGGSVQTTLTSTCCIGRGVTPSPRPLEPWWSCSRRAKSSGGA